MDVDTTAQQIELDMASAQALIKHADALSRLMQNPDFQAVILNGYFKDEAVRLVSAKAAPQMKASENQEAILTALDGIGSLQQHINTVFALGENARSAIEDGRQALDEIATEEGEI